MEKEYLLPYQATHRIMEYFVQKKNLMKYPHKKTLYI